LTGGGFLLVFVIGCDPNGTRVASSPASGALTLGAGR
jgi:hypothetical protein